jgi:hypothetical protein
MSRVAARVFFVCLLTTGFALPAAADDGLQDLCSDRPTKSTDPCTVDMGHWQVESDFVSYSDQSDDGLRTKTLLVADPTIKWGLTGDSDLEVSFTPYETIRQSSANGHSNVSGFGDIYVHYKNALVQEPDGSFAMVIEPYIKLPSASAGLGNGAVEGGAVAPISFALPLGVTLTSDPELDILKNASGSGYHAGASTLIDLGRQITPTISGAIEIWTNEDFDPAGTIRQTSLDVAFAWLARRELQFDIGLNAGLNAATPRLQIYNGVTFKF